MRVLFVLPKFTKLICLLAFSLGLLTGCVQSMHKNTPSSSIDKRWLAQKGHIELKPKVESIVEGAAAIPHLNSYQTIEIPFNEIKPANLYSVSAVNVPVKELLFRLAQDAEKQIDIYTGVSGHVTMNALDQPLNTILSRISHQLNFIFEIQQNVIVVRPDTPDWRNYQVDYVNIQKSSEDRIDMKMTVSSSTNSASNLSNIGSSSQVSVKSEHDFWQRLEANIKRLTHSGANTLPHQPLTDVPIENSANPSSKSSNVVMNPETGSISVYANQKQHQAVKQYITMITKRAQRQVLIEATVVEVILNDDYQSGIDWSFAKQNLFGGMGGVAVNLPFTNRGVSNSLSVATTGPTGAIGALQTGATSLLANLSFLEEFGDSKVLSSPKIMAINNQTALLKVVENLVYFTVDVDTTTGDNTSNTTYETEVNTVPVGFTMSVTPFVSDTGEVTLNIRPTISRLVDQVKDPNPQLAAMGVESLIPVIQEKEMSSVLKLQDRQTAIIGGLIEDTQANSQSGVPGLNDLPFLGGLFSKKNETKRKSELVIFIRPVVVDRPDIDAGDLSSLAIFLPQEKNGVAKNKSVTKQQIIFKNSSKSGEE